MINLIPPGIYEALIDEYLRDTLALRPELRTVFGKIDPEEQPAKYASFVAKVLEQALREESDAAKRLALCNHILGHVASEPGRGHLDKHRLIQNQKPILLEITPPHYGKSGIPRPHTSLTESSLFTGSPQEPQLGHELLEEMRSADGVDILVSFIKWPGLRLLMPAFEDLRDRDIPVRLITTSYMGASDAPAVEWLAGLPNVKVRVSYDTERTRLHAKAYHFKRGSGFATAYIGSSNMSQAAMTSGLEWNLKVTAQDMGHIIEKLTAEFDTYWHNREFIPFDPQEPEVLRAAIAHGKDRRTGPPVFFNLRPHPFQERILEALERERTAHDRWRNLVIAATGTGKTVVAAFDFKRFFESKQKQAKLLFVAHRQEILQQARATFANVLRDQNFGELLVGQFQATRLEHLFCSVGMLTSRRLWEQVGSGFYDYIVVDEAHHGTASSYRPLFDHFTPQILLGLTATPERMDGDNVAADFGNRFAAEIRLPEALEEKLLCPFHYFGVADPIAINGEQFWRNGKYDASALENVYVLDNVSATPFIAVTGDLVELNELFNLYWRRIIPLGQTSSIAFPFSRLDREPFWDLVSQPRTTITPAIINNTSSVTYLRKYALGASLDEVLFRIMQSSEGREALRDALLQSCFSVDAAAQLREQSIINREAFYYSQMLEEQAHLQLVQEIVEADNYRPAARDQGFRRIVVKAYDHRCALCGVRIITSEQHTVVDAAHIVPWSRSQNDDIRNGMALCKLCHWAFDEGMMGVSDSYAVITSHQIAADPNVPGFLQTLSGRSIIPPSDRDLWPAQQYLVEHRREWRLP